MGRNLFVVGHVLGTSAASRLRALLLPSCVVLGVASGSAARADCAPAAANNVTATCSGTTTNQGAGAPGTSAGTAGYGTGVQTGVTVDVAAGAGNTVTGTTFGIYLGDAAVNNNALASITGGNTGIRALSGFADVTNSGSIAGTSFAGINAGTNATVTNNATASITGGSLGIRATSGFANVTNSGSIIGTNLYGIFAGTNATVTNNATASITGGGYGIVALGGFANVTNSGSIIGTSQYGIYALTNATVTNNATGIITGIDANAGFANVTNSGSITGGQYGIRAGGGGSSVFNAGTISGGIAAIQFAGVGNTLTLALGSVITGNVLGTGSDTFQLGGTGSATFNVSQIGAAAQYRGFGTFNKIGSSAWTLTGASTFAGPINVNGGTLGINGNVTSASGVTVNAGGTLAGTGTVGNTLVTGGIFAPGTGTPGSSMTVTGALGFNPASTYAVNLNPATSSFATVSGAATLGGATVNASFAPGGYISRQYTILTAGSISGTFNPVVTNFNLPANFHDSLSYDATHAYLDLALNFAIPGGLTGNQQDVGNALTNFFNRTGGIPAVFGTLTPAGLSQAAGETATGSQQTTSNAMTQFMGVMTDPLVAGRGVPISAASGAAGYADEQTMAYAAKRNPTDALAAIYTKAPPPVPFTQRWSAWAAGFGGSQSTDGSVAAGSNNTTSRLFGVAAGADYRFSPNTVAGFALAGGGTSFGVNGFGSGRSDLFQAGAFFRHTVGAAYLSGALAYGWQDVTTDRTVTIAGIDRLRAQFNANAFSGRAEAGYRFVSPWIGGVGITPYAAGQFTTFDLPAYAEQVVSGANTFALAYAAKSIAATRSELGFRADKSFAMQSAILTLRGRAAWAHDFNPHRTVGATFQTLPGASFVVNGARQASNAALTTASAEVKWMNGFSLAGTFEGEFSNVTRSYAGKGVARYTW